MVRIRGFHPRGPGSIPGIGILMLYITTILLYSPVVRTPDFESGNPSSTLGRANATLLAQLVERRAFNPRVVGSSPTGSVSPF